MITSHHRKVASNLKLWKKVNKKQRQLSRWMIVLLAVVVLHLQSLCLLNKWVLKSSSPFLKMKNKLILFYHLSPSVHLVSVIKWSQNNVFWRFQNSLQAISLQSRMYFLKAKVLKYAMSLLSKSFCKHIQQKNK